MKLEQLKKLNINRLLQFYKSERSKFYNKKYKCTCWGEFMWDIDEKYDYLKEQYKLDLEYLNLIKLELSTRENIKKWQT